MRKLIRRLVSWFKPRSTADAVEEVVRSMPPLRNYVADEHIQMHQQLLAQLQAAGQVQWRNNGTLAQANITPNMMQNMADQQRYWGLYNPFVTGTVLDTTQMKPKVKKIQRNLPDWF